MPEISDYETDSEYNTQDFNDMFEDIELSYDSDTETVSDLGSEYNFELNEHEFEDLANLVDLENQDYDVGRRSFEELVSLGRFVESFDTDLMVNDDNHDTDYETDYETDYDTE